MAQFPWEEEEEQGPWNDDVPSAENPQTPQPYVKTMGYGEAGDARFSMPVIDKTEPKKVELANVGVDVTTPTPEGLETGKRAFAQDEMWTDYANARLGQLVPGSKYGMVEGEPVWFNPKTKLWTRMKDSTKGQALLRIAGENMTTAGGLAPMVGPQGTNPAGIITTAALKTAAATGALEGTRQAIGRAMGVNDANIERITKESLSKGAEAGAYDVAGGLAVQGFKYGKEAFKGRPVLPPAMAEELLNDIGEYDELIGSLKNPPDKIPLHWTAKENSFSARAAETLWQDASKADGNLGYQVDRINDGMHTALRNHIEEASKPFDVGIPPTNEGRYLAGQPIQEGIQQDLKQQLGASADAATADQLRLANAGEALPISKREAASSAGARVREQMWAQAQKAKAGADDAYQQFKFSMGIGDDLKSPHMVRISDPATLKALENHVFNKETGELVAGNKLRQNADGSWSVDVGTMWKASQRARAVVRKKKNPTILDEDVQRSEELITKAMHDYVKQGSIDGSLPPDAYKLLENADATYRQYKQTWEEGFRADFLEQTSSGKWVIKDQNLLSSILRGKDIEAASELKDIIAGDPVAMNEMRKALLAVAGSASNMNGAPSAKLLRKFMEDDGYRPMIDLFFDKKTYGQIDTLTDLANAAERSAKDLKTFQGAIRARFGSQFIRMSPEDFSTYIFRKSTKFDDARMLTKLSMRYPDAYESLQNGIANEIKRQVFPQGLGGKVDPSRLTKLLDEHSTNIAAVMGHEYTQDLRTVAKILPLIQREALGTGAPATMNRFQSFIRGMIRPFSREGNILAWLGRNRGDNIAPQVIEILTDRDALKNLANYSRKWMDMTKGGSMVPGLVELQHDDGGGGR